MARVALAEAHLDLAGSGTVPGEPSDGSQALDVAERHAAKALESCPKLPEAHLALGRAWSIRALRNTDASDAQEAERAWQNATDHYRKALRATNDAHIRADTQRKLALAWLGLHEPDQAEEALRAAAEFDPSDRRTWDVFLDHSRATGRHDVLVRSLEQAFERLKREGPQQRDGLADVGLLLAAAYEETGVAGKAGPILEEALALAPGRLDVWAAWFDSLDPGERRSALGHRLPENRAEMSNLPPPLSIVAAVLRQDGSEIAPLFPRFAELCAERAARLTTEQMASEYGWVARILNDELANASLPLQDQVVAEVAMGRAFAVCGMWEQAAGAYARATPFLPEEGIPRVLLEHSEVLAHCRKHSEALAAAQEAMQHAPGNLEVRWTLARRLASAGRRAEARLEYRMLLESPMIADETRRQLEQELEALKERKREALP
jgi:tetratricopeptide (TPR) repeat protein